MPCSAHCANSARTPGRRDAEALQKAVTRRHTPESVFEGGHGYALLVWNRPNVAKRDGPQDHVLMQRLVVRDDGAAKRLAHPSRTQPVVGTGVVFVECSSSLSTSAGGFHARVFCGRVLSATPATRSIRAVEARARKPLRSPQRARVGTPRSRNGTTPSEAASVAGRLVGSGRRAGAPTPEARRH